MISGRSSSRFEQLAGPGHRHPRVPRQVRDRPEPPRVDQRLQLPRPRQVARQPPVPRLRLRRPQVRALVHRLVQPQHRPVARVLDRALHGRQLPQRQLAQHLPRPARPPQVRPDLRHQLQERQQLAHPSPGHPLVPRRVRRPAVLLRVDPRGAAAPGPATRGSASVAPPTGPPGVARFRFAWRDRGDPPRQAEVPVARFRIEHQRSPTACRFG
jgi:hypothetical protein